MSIESHAAPKEKGAAHPERFIRSHGAMREKPWFVPHERSATLGAHGDEEIPVPIPNTEVKLISGDYTATSGKLARCRIIKRASE